jgi:hypothetical protein
LKLFWWSEAGGGRQTSLDYHREIARGDSESGQGTVDAHHAMTRRERAVA